MKNFWDYICGLFVVVVFLGMCAALAGSVTHATVPPAPTKHSQVVVFSETDTVPPNSYLPVTAESAHYPLLSLSVQDLLIKQASCSLSADSETGVSALKLEAANATLGIGLYGPLGNFIAELNLAQVGNPMGPLSAPSQPFATPPLLPLTYWGGLTAVMPSPFDLDLVDYIAAAPKPATWTVGLDADVWNIDPTVAYKIDEYCVLVVEETY